jgi:hypothetical protein
LIPSCSTAERSSASTGSCTSNQLFRGFSTVTVPAPAEASFFCTVAFASASSRSAEP